ncbi:ABC transporter ATP-binding protein [Anoxybacterium hadale]|uniref:ABC transporter ATP-binding protein n=1 Tax=Anoxybacterium hadale TaxID=3408580 RepID=A0ACD1AE86_9FIRM|nr:ABC transporter ATP-binding protein [Clostridiales bacterium]
MVGREGGVLSIRDLKMNFGAKEVLKGVNLDVDPGEIIGYIGANGAGKSTTVKIMLGLLTGYTGNVKILGKDIAEGDIEYKRRIGYVPEIAEIYDTLTAREYLTFIGALYGLAYETTEIKARKLMRLFDIEDMFDSKIAACSKGMKQKVMIIASLLHNPDILFLDEPLSGLDANSMLVVKEILARLAAQGKTVFYSSHIMDVVEKISHRIVLLNDGIVAADGSFDELKNQLREGSLEEIFNQLTGFKEHASIAEEFTAVVQGA